VSGRRKAETIDALVVSEADDMSKWSTPIKVNPSVTMALYLKPTIVLRAKKIAKQKKVKNYRLWLMNIIIDQLKREEQGLQAGLGKHKRGRSVVTL